MEYLGESGDYKKYKDEKDIIQNSTTRVHEQIPLITEIDHPHT